MPLSCFDVVDNGRPRPDKGTFSSYDEAAMYSLCLYIPIRPQYNWDLLALLEVSHGSTQACCAQEMARRRWLRYPLQALHYSQVPHLLTYFTIYNCFDFSVSVWHLGAALCKFQLLSTSRQPPSLKLSSSVDLQNTPTFEELHPSRVFAHLPKLTSSSTTHRSSAMPINLVEPRFFLDPANEEDAVTAVPESDIWSRAIDITAVKHGLTFNVSSESHFIGGVNDLKNISGATLIGNTVCQLPERDQIYLRSLAHS